MTLQERTRQSRHQEWLANQAYSRVFANRSIIWAEQIDNQPHKCRCGCDAVWYGPTSNANMLGYLFPIVLFRLLWQQRALYPLFRSLHAFLQAALLIVLNDSLPEWARQYRLLWLSMFWEPTVRHAQSHSWYRVVGRGVLLPAGAVAFVFWASLWTAAFVLTWSSRVLAFPMVLALYIVSLMLVVSLFVVASVMAAIYVVARGLAFVVAGVASVIYSYHLEIGVALIVLGLLIEYGFRYRDEKRHRFQLGHIIALQQSPSAAPTRKD